MAEKKAQMSGVGCINGRWYAYVFGKKKWFGRGKDGQDRAEQARSDFLEAKRRGKDLQAGLKREESKWSSVGQMIDWWILDLQQDRVQPKQRGRKKAYKTITPRTFTRYTQQASRLHEFFGGRPFLDVDDGRIREYRRYRKREHDASENTITAELKRLKSCYEDAVKNNKIPKEYMPKDWPLYTEQVPRPKVNDKQYERLLATADKIGWHDFKDFMVHAYETGMRLDEICSLTLDQLNLEPERAFIKLGFDTKSGRERIVPVSEELYRVLERRVQGKIGKALVYTDRKGNAWYYATVEYYMRRLCEAASVPYGDKLIDEEGRRVGITFHSFKATRVTKWYDQGLPESTISLICGTDTGSILRAHYRDSDVDAILAQVNGNRTKTGQKVGNDHT